MTTPRQPAPDAAPEQEPDNPNIGPPIVVDGRVWANPGIVTWGIESTPPSPAQPATAAARQPEEWLRLADEEAEYHIVITDRDEGADLCALCSELWPCPQMCIVAALRAAAERVARLEAVEMACRTLFESIEIRRSITIGDRLLQPWPQQKHDQYQAAEAEVQRHFDALRAALAVARDGAGA